MAEAGKPNKADTKRVPGGALPTPAHIRSVTAPVSLAAQAAAARENQLKASQTQRLEQERASHTAMRENQLRAVQTQRLEQASPQ